MADGWGTFLLIYRDKRSSPCEQAGTRASIRADVLTAL